MTEIQELALKLARGLRPTANNVSRVGIQCSPENAQWAFRQWSLRDRAKSKFELAGQMLFDEDGLEMATSERLAAYHASKFPQDCSVVDIGTGIGADLIALTRTCRARGYEIDPLRAGYALHNLALHGGNATVIVEDGLEAEWACEYAFCDPARRNAGKRTLNLSEFSPDPQLIAERFRCLRLGGIKLSPMLTDKELEAFGGAIEFISFGGECREAMIWLGRDSPTISRLASHVESGQSIPARGDPPVVLEPSDFIYEADPAAIRGHCLGWLCSDLELSSLGDSNGYLTGKRSIASPWLKRYKVLTVHNADLKRTQSEMKRLGGGTPVVKCRGAQVDVEGLRKQLRGDGENLILIVYPVGRSLKHVICRLIGE